MGLASKIGGGAARPSAPPMQGAPPAGGAYGAPPTQQPGAYGAPTPPGYPQVGAPGGPPQQPAYGAPPQGQSPYGQAPQQQQPGGPAYGAPPQQPGASPYGAPPQQQQQPGANPYGAPPQQQQQPGANPYGAPPQQQQQPAANPYGAQQPGAPRQGASPFPQQPQHGAPAGGACPPGVPGAAGFDMPTIRQKLAQLVAENRLQAFYPPQRLDQVAQFVAGRDVAGLGARWRLPREIALDLVALALYDIVLYVDDSGSMAFEEGGERIEDMRVVVGRVADAATLFDSDGIVVRFMNSPVEGNGIRSEAEAAALVQQVRFSGLTPLGTSLDRKVLQPLVLGQARAGNMSKPVLVMCVSDGEPAGEPKDTVRQVVLNAKRVLGGTPYGSGAVAFQFAQVGKDAGATRFLSALDTDPEIGGMVDCTSFFEQEQEEYARKGINLTPETYLVKLLCGPVDRSYDEADE